MDLFKNALKFGVIGSFVGMFMGALMFTIAFTVSGIFFTFMTELEGIQMFYAISMCVGSLAGGSAGALAGIFGGVSKK